MNGDYQRHYVPLIHGSIHMFYELAPEERPKIVLPDGKEKPEEQKEKPKLGFRRE